MNGRQLQAFRQQLGKTQKQLSELMGTSLKAIQSFEQGWRKIPVHIERQILFLLASQKKRDKGAQPCWEIQHCPSERRQHCPAWEFHTGHLCWFINGTICHGSPQTSWSKKMIQCRKCRVFKSHFLISEPGVHSL